MTGSPLPLDAVRGGLPPLLKQRPWECAIDEICAHPLFAEIGECEVAALLLQGEAAFAEYRKDDFLGMIGDKAPDPYRLGCLLSGLAYHERYDGLGNCRISDVAEPGALLNAAAVFGGDPVYRTSLRVEKPCRCLHLRLDAIDWASAGGAGLRARLYENVARIQARDARRLYAHVSQLGKRTVRQKIVAYCLSESRERRSRSFDIPFNQQALANYLCVTRSTLSVELGKLADEGLLSYDRGHIEISPDVKTSGAV